MAINIKFDLAGNPEIPTIILAKRNGDKLGQLYVNADSVDLSDKLNGASEITFTLNKYIDNEITPLWNEVTDFKLIWCKEWDVWFEIKVELDEATETVKTVFCTQLGQSELSQLMLYDIHINEEGDPNWNPNVDTKTYKSTILYDERNKNASLLDRLLKDKAPHYSIAHVDSTIANIQRTFSFDGTSICDAFNEIAEEIGCLFVYNSNSTSDGKPNRTISVYDLQQNCNCNGCRHRGEFTEVCPKCGSTNINYNENVFKDTTIFVTADELASNNITLTTDTDSVKNCFKLEAGDDLMTATVRNCNPNGSDYIWYFSEFIKNDMSKGLRDKINSYDIMYKQNYNGYVSNIDAGYISEYNRLIDKYSTYNSDLKNMKITTPITGYSSLMNAYYNVIDLAYYLKSGLMPSVEMSETNATEQARLLTSVALSPVAVANIKNASLATADSAVLAMAKIIVKPTFKVKVNTSELSALSSDEKTKTWNGNFIITNYSDEEDEAVSNTISVTINGDQEGFVKQKIEKALNKDNTDDLSVSGLFEKELLSFTNELKKYALNPLISFRDAAQSCIDILIEQGIGKDVNADLYKNLYLPYFNKLGVIEDEITIRENEVNLLNGVYNKDGELTKDGLITKLEECKNQIQKTLNFQEYLGNDLWLEFASYRREDKYSNSNYTSEGLEDNGELFKKALEFIEVAENEIYKSAELQHSISTTLKNLLAIDKFKPLVDSFEVGNWLRIQINDEVYKLRLLEYKISFGDFSDISVEFSDVMKIKNGISDINSILSQASSMATSYESVQRQANQGSNANNTVDKWLADGLNSALVQIQNNNNEEITLTRYGLLGRSYDEITGTYSPKQIRLTHNILAFTDDNWKTVSTALGEHNYNYYDSVKKDFVTSTDYGLSAKFVTAGVVSGSQIIGGEIYSSNYKPKQQGSYFDLINGDFQLAGGKMLYNSGTNILDLQNVVIHWDNVGAPSISNIDGLVKTLNDLSDGIEDAKDYADGQDNALKTNLTKDLTQAYQDYANSEISKLDNAVAKYLGVGGTTLIGDTYVISPYIAGGYLNITKNSSNARVIIDPNNLTSTGYIFQVHGQDEIVVGIDISGNAVFKGTIKATSLELVGNTKVPANKVDGLSSVATSGNYNDLNGKPAIPTSVKDLGFNPNNVIYKGDITQTTETDSNGNTYLLTTVPTASGGTIEYSTYRAEDYMVFGRSRGINSGKQNYVCISKDGLLTARNAWIYGTVYATDGEFIGRIDSNRGLIGGWEIKTNSVSKPYTVGSDGRPTILGSGLGSTAGVAGLVFWAAYNGGATGYRDPYEEYDAEMKKPESERDVNSWKNKTGFYVLNNGHLKSTNVEIESLYIYDSTSNTKIRSLYYDGNSDGITCVNNGINLKSGYKCIFSEGNSVFIGAAKVTGHGVANTVRFGIDGKVQPGTDNSMQLGSSNYKWSNIYATTSSIGASDRTMKDNIKSLTDIHEQFFMKLLPVSFTFKDGTSGRTHVGFISQDVEDAMNELGMTSLDFAGFCKDIKVKPSSVPDEVEPDLDENGNEQYIYSLRYGEFVALNTYMIQKLSQRISDLENKLGMK